MDTILQNTYNQYRFFIDNYSSDYFFFYFNMLIVFLLRPWAELS